jgi:hypothetical protein
MDDDFEEVDSQRCVAALIPAASSFSLDSAVAHFGGLKYGRARLRAEKVRGGRKSASGFRVAYGDWAVAIWLNKEPLTEVDYNAMLRAKPLPVPGEVIRSCRQLLTIWADPDPGGERGKQWAHCLGHLRAAFGALIWDYDSDDWWAA